jgi:anti-sigma factor RsiW
MNQDEIEFQISQYLDGTLSMPERAAVEERLAVDADARRLLGEYRRLNEQLLHNLPLPTVKWDRLAEHLSAVVDEASAPAVAGRIFPAVLIRRMAIAACLALATGLSLHYFQVHRNAAESDSNPVVVVIGPTVEASDDAAVEEIDVGPSADFASHGGIFPASQKTDDRPGRAVMFSAPLLNGS